MDKHQLARALRQRQYDKGLVERKYIDVLSDEQIIASYTTCSGCGKGVVSDAQVETAIHLATSADHFLQLTASHTHE